MTRSPLICGAPIAGLLAGAAVWLLAGGPQAPGRALDVLGRPSAAPTGPAAAGDTVAAVAALANRPLFAAGPARLPRITLIGVSRIPGRSAALVALGDSEPAWISVGQTIEGLTLVSARADQVRFDSVDGPITVPLGETIDPGTADAPPTGTSPDSVPPSGVKLPPEPASAPRP